MRGRLNHLESKRKGISDCDKNNHSLSPDRSECTLDSGSVCIVTFPTVDCDFTHIVSRPS